MIFHVASSLLFLSAMICALAVIFATFRSYRGQMIAALRSLNMGSVHAPERSATARHGAGLHSKLV